MTFGIFEWGYFKRLFENEGVLPYEGFSTSEIQMLEARDFVEVRINEVIMTQKGLDAYLEEAEKEAVEEKIRYE